MKSNGRTNGMKKFNVKIPQYAYYQYQKSNSILLGIGGGHDIRVYKKGQNGSCCHQTDSATSFNYEGISCSLCSSSNSGRQYFTPKRITVIQMK